MAMRMSGLVSGMDTESIIQQLVEAKSVKVKTAQKAQTKLDWKRDAWKELNTKLKNLQSKYLSNMRFSSSYSKKVTKVSNPNAVSVITGENAVNGVQSLEITDLAKTGYLTGGVVKKAADATDKEPITASTKISQLDGFSGNGTIQVKNGNTSVNIDITSETTISDVLTKLKDAGLNASFDAKWQRFSVSSKESGKDNDFSITAVDLGGANALVALKLAALDEESADYKEYDKYSKYYKHVEGDDAKTLADTLAALKDEIDSDVASKTDSYLAKYKSLAASLKSAQDKVKDYKDNYSEATKSYADQVTDKNADIAKWKEDLKNETLTDEEKKTLNDNIAQAQKEVKELQSLADIKKIEGQMADVKQYVNITETEDSDGNITYSATATSKLQSEVEAEQFSKAQTAAAIMGNKAEYSTDATKVSGQDAKISLNGAVYTNSTNVFEINGLTFTALAKTNGEEVTVTTEQDVDGIYDMVKSFLKEYNSIINEMDKLYNADSAKDYEPLTDEEKETMSDSEIEKYEKKIKDALLRRDENLNTVGSALKSVMSSGIDVNGKTMYLFDFGINTLSYFNAADNEKNAYHIDGDPDDGDTSGNADKLKSMIANDPDTVISFFTKLSQNLYGKMSDLSKSVDGYRSFGSFYDDKKMKSDYDDYTTKIKNLEDKLNDYEDKWYKKFAAMETAMAKMQQNANAVTSLLGGA